jgi:hypothetical protein
MVVVRHAQCAAAALLVAFVATTAVASEQGIIGFSGKQSDGCDSCHDDGIAPLVALEGPARFAADTRVQFRFVVQSQGERQTFAGFNVAASDGLLLIGPEENGRVEVNELTHNAPEPNDEAGQASWTFDWCVPVGGDVRLFGSGNSVNGNGTRSGDAASETELEVRVTPPLGDVNCDGRRSAADVSAVFTSETAGVPGACESPDDEIAAGTTELDTTIEVIFIPACQL